MEIFILDEDPGKAAEMLCDHHVTEQCDSIAQILSGVMLRRNQTLHEDMPTVPDTLHPAMIAADDNNAINWVLDYNIALQDEYHHRFGKKHQYDSLAMEYVIELCVMFFKVSCRSLVDSCSGRKHYIEVEKPTLQAQNMWHFTKREDWTK